MSASTDLGRASGSPLKLSMSEISRPQSGAGLELGKKRGLGVKEMEQVISTLHKQNFDLKLELYHRRERQTTLEERLDDLENDRQRMEEVNDKLLVELEKRDKAVEEAVAMIITLEMQVEQLFRERSMAERMENESFFSQGYEIGYRTPVAHGLGPDIVKMENDAKAVNRVPSFLSDHSEATENLRNVYLGTKGSSMLSLPRLLESSPEGDTLRTLGSPTLSVLSESSFASIYGRRENGAVGDAACTEVDETIVHDGDGPTLMKISTEHQMSRGKAGSVPPDGAVVPRASSATHFPSITDLMAGSPLQRLERLDGSWTSQREEGLPQSRERDHPKTHHTASDAPSAAPGALGKDRRDTLRRVLTEGPGGVRLHDHGLPPTPDTISSSTLQRLQGSDDALAHEQDVIDDSCNGVSLKSSVHDETWRDSHGEAVADQHQPELDSWASLGKPPIESPFDHHRGPLIPRPRSADESTTSHGRGKAWDSDLDDDSDTRSLQSSLDIWMRESDQSKGRSRESPDLFSFPANVLTGNCASAASMLPIGAEAGRDQPPPGFDYMRDLFSLRQGLFGNAAPPPPSRRSSLQATTGSSEASSLNAGKHGGEKRPRSSATKRRSYHSRQNSVDLGRRDDLRTPVQRDQFSAPPPQPSSEQRCKHYPPLSGQQNGTRVGLNRLFRRSTSGTSTAPPCETSAFDINSAEPSSSKHMVGVPSWSSRASAVDDDRTGATPPPIMFNPRQGRRNTLGAEVEAERAAAQDCSRSKTPNPAMAAAAASKEEANVESSPAAPLVAGGRRKWLSGFSRTGSSKNRSG